MYQKDIARLVMNTTVKPVRQRTERQYVPKKEIATVFRKDIARLVMNTTVKLVR